MGTKHQDYTQLAFESEGFHILFSYLRDRSVTRLKIAELMADFVINEARGYKNGVHTALTIIHNLVKSGGLDLAAPADDLITLLYGSHKDAENSFLDSDDKVDFNFLAGLSETFQSFQDLFKEKS